MRPDGADKRMLRPDGAAPDFSPNGKRIAFECKCGHYYPPVYLMTEDGTLIRRLSHVIGASDPSFSPNGRRIAFTHGHDQEFEIFTVRPDGTHQRRRTHLHKFIGSINWQPLPDR